MDLSAEERKRKYMAARDAESIANEAGDSAVLERLTERIAERLRVEIHSELAQRNKAIPTKPMDDQALNERISELLDATTHSSLCVCGICFELMTPPTHSPMILSPCGHTFCSLCVKNQEKTARTFICPVCRSRVKSKATNYSLLQLVETLGRKRHDIVEQVKVPELPTDTEALDAQIPANVVGEEREMVRRCLHTYNSLFARITILKQERDEAEVEVNDIDVTAAELAVKASQNEVDRLEAKIADLQAELDEVREKQGVRDAEYRRIQMLRADALQRRNLCEEALTPLHEDMEKQIILLSNFDLHMRNPV